MINEFHLHKLLPRLIPFLLAYVAAALVTAELGRY